MASPTSRRQRFSWLFAASSATVRNFPSTSSSSRNICSFSLSSWILRVARAVWERGGSQGYGLVGLALQGVGENRERRFGVLAGFEGGLAAGDEQVGFGVARGLGAEAGEECGGKGEGGVEEVEGGARGWG